MSRWLTKLLMGSLLLIGFSSWGMAQQIEIPRRHDRPPNAALSPEEAIARMTVPEGFSVELVAAEPEIMNPVAMCIDERGRFWITESFEYPRREPGPGRDRIKVLEDTDGDGRVDRVTVFAEGLNIPSGIAVGYGGVWVCNAPDLLFLQDTDGDGKADRSEVVVTGFGRTDTHELPNSLTWGPDGWLYGLNGVFNYCSVTYGPENPNFRPDQKSVDFTCALFRVHPRTREFQIFAEGTSNPWGLAMNPAGDFFVSACVIDHLWNLAENGYYIRQGGPYPPHTWPLPSIVKHKHQKAAYCGLTWFDSDAYPPEYRGVLYMGNIHGGCINADLVERQGATYFGKPHPGFIPQKDAWKNDQYGTIAKSGSSDQPRLADLLTANDAWFMPVVQKVGPDGCLYILDWYDRYHCYQDANADPAGVDRAKGRLYRLRYQETPHAKPFNLAEKSDGELISLLASANIYHREIAQRLLSERATPEVVHLLEEVVTSNESSQVKRMHALWGLAGTGHVTDDILAYLINSHEPVLKTWGVRLTGNLQRTLKEFDALLAASEFQPLEVQQQLVVSLPKIAGEKSLPFLLKVATQQDDLLNHIVWQNLLRILNTEKAAENATESTAVLIPILESQYAAGKSVSPEFASRLFVRLLDEKTPETALQLLRCVAVHEGSQSNTFATMLKQLNSRLSQNGFNPKQQEIVTTWSKTAVEELQQTWPVTPPEFDTLLALCGDAVAANRLRERFAAIEIAMPARLEALQALIFAHDPKVVDVFESGLFHEHTTEEFRSRLLETIGRVNDPRVATLLLSRFAKFQPDVQPKVIEVLTQRPTWSLALLKEIEAGRIDKNQINLNQLMRMNAFPDEALHQMVQKNFGTVRTTRSNRQELINQKKDFLSGTPGDPMAGAAVFKRVCAQCHKIYGEGADVGPDITRNGRNNWDQLLQNLFDPSAVIGPGYQARLIATEDGRVLTGLPVEDSPERVVLKIQGGKLETIPRSQIEADKLSELSMMPEDVDKLMTSQELADLLAYLSLDKPPEDATAKILPGAPRQQRR